jgi:hypothetical protein
MTPTAPYQSCICCFKGDVTTALAVNGEAEFHIAFLNVNLGVGPEVAADMVQVEPGLVPDGMFPVSYRICSECAEQKGLEVGVTYAQSAEPAGKEDPR